MPINEKGEFLRPGKPPARRTPRRARSAVRYALGDAALVLLAVAGLALLVGLIWFLVVFHEWILIGSALWFLSIVRRWFG